MRRDARWWRAVATTLCGALALVAGPVVAQEAAVVEKVAVFKNGMSVVTFGGVISGREARVPLGPLPVPSLGSVTATVERPAELVALVALDVEREQPATSLGEVLQANLGAQVTIHLSEEDYGSESVVRGEVLSLSPTLTELDALAMARYDRARVPRLVVVATADGVEAFPLARVQRVRGESLARGVLHSEPRLRLDLARPAPGRRFSVRYLAKGLGWFPAYVFDISDSDTVSVRATAEVVNELADLDGVQLELVVGSPHTAFADVESPLGGADDLGDLFRAIDSGASGRFYRSDHSGQTATMNTALQGSPGEEGGYLARADGRTEDLFFHPIDEFSLAKGASAWLELGRARMPFEHVYRWQVRDRLAEPEEAAPGPEDDVWHSVRVHNTADWPLTTAPVLFEKGGRVIGQSRVTYTPPGSRNVVRLTRALEISVSEREVEVARESIEDRIQGYYYNRVTLEGTLSARNRMDRVADLEIEKALRGELASAAGDPRIEATTEGVVEVNPRLQLTWERKLAPGETVEVSYRYQALVRR